MARWKIIVLVLVAVEFYFAYMLFCSYYMRTHQYLETSQDLILSSGFGSYRTGLIVHSAYFDDRPRNGYSNVTVIFITLNTTLWKANGILGCGTNSADATSFEVYSPMENVEARKHSQGRHKQENLLILCYDLPVQNGSTVYVFQKASPSSKNTLRLHSEYPIFFPAPRIKPAGEDHITIVACLKVHNRSSHLLKEMIQYQKTIGVDHVYISALDLFMRDGGYHDFIENDADLYRLLRSGYLSLRVWKNEEGLEIIVNSEVIRKLECTYRFRGTYDYVMPLDTDDFFVPRVKGKSKLRDYIKDYCYEKPIASCQFVWVWLLPECGLSGRVGPDGNVTKHLKSFANFNNSNRLNFKSAHNFTHLWDNGFHDATCKDCLMPGYMSVIVPTHIAYVGHIRYGQKRKVLETHCSRPPFSNFFTSVNTSRHFMRYL